LEIREQTVAREGEGEGLKRKKAREEA